MNDLFVVISYTIKEMLKKKTFIISNLILILIMIIGFNVPNFLKKIENDDAQEGKILILDEQNVFEGTLETLNNMELGYSFEISQNEINFEEIKNKIESKEIENAIIVHKENGQIKIEYIVENIATTHEIPETCVNALTTIYRNLQISKLGLTEEQVQVLNPNFNFEIKQTESQEVKGNVVAIMLLSLVLFYAIYFCAYQVSTSITTEKTSKIMETLVTSTTPRTIVIGKTIGIGIVGLIQVVVLVSVALICAYFCLPEGILSSVIDLSQMTPFLAIMTVIYFLLGYLVYALLYALTGSTVSKPEDVQSANRTCCYYCCNRILLSIFYYDESN